MPRNNPSDSRRSKEDFFFNRRRRAKRAHRHSTSTFVDLDRPSSQVSSGTVAAELHIVGPQRTERTTCYRVLPYSHPVPARYRFDQVQSNVRSSDECQDDFLSLLRLEEAGGLGRDTSPKTDSSSGSSTIKASSTATLEPPDMGVFPPKKSVPKDRFSTHMSTLKTQTYHDHSSRGSGSNIRTLAWSNTGSRIATGAADRTVRVWNPDRPQLKYSTELRGHNGAISYVVWNPTNDYELASCSSDGTVRLWDVRSKTSRSEIKTGNEPFTMAWRPDGSVLMVGRKDDALLPIHFPADGGPPVAQPALPQKQQTNQTLFSHSGDELLVSIGTGSVNILRYPEMDLIETFNGHTSSCLCLDLDPTAKMIAIGGSDALISIWDTAEGFVRRGLDGMIGPVRSVGFSFDGAYVCGGSDEGTGIKIAHVESGDYVHTVPTAHPAACVAWHPQRYWIAYSGDPQGLKIVGAAP